MATCIASALQNFNSPYRIAVTDETSKRADLYDLSDGASYTVIEDFASWTIALATSIKHSNHTSKKVGEIHSKYSLHYQEISQLKPAQKNAIYRAMYSNDLRPPIQVIQHAKTVLGDFNPVKSIFSEPAKKENDNAKWIREGFNKFLNAAYLPSIPSPEEQHEQNLTQRVESLYVHQLQWIVMGLCKLDPIEISDVYFKMLHKRATELTPDKSCDLVEKLKLATSLSHLKTLV